MGGEQGHRVECRSGCLPEECERQHRAGREGWRLYRCGEHSGSTDVSAKSRRGSRAIQGLCVHAAG